MRNWWRRQRLIWAYTFMRNAAERHRRQGHDVEFNAVNETLLILRCHTCVPEWRGERR